MFLMYVCKHIYVCVCMHISYSGGLGFGAKMGAGIGDMGNDGRKVSDHVCGHVWCD